MSADPAGAAAEVDETGRLTSPKEGRGRPPMTEGLGMVVLGATLVAGTGGLYMAWFYWWPWGLLETRL
jgi:fatty acid desaturase